MQSHVSTRRLTLVAGAAVLLVGMLAGCASSSDGTTTSGSAATSSAPAPSSSDSKSSSDSVPGGAVITIKGFMFMAPASVPAGSTVTVKNEDSTAHTVTAGGDGGFDVTVAANSTGTFTAPAQAGSYAYVCSFHGNMKGTLMVS